MRKDRGERRVEGEGNNDVVELVGESRGNARGMGGVRVGVTFLRFVLLGEREKEEEKGGERKKRREEGSKVGRQTVTNDDDDEEKQLEISSIITGY